MICLSNDDLLNIHKETGYNYSNKVMGWYVYVYLDESHNAVMGVLLLFKELSPENFKYAKQN